MLEIIIGISICAHLVMWAYFQTQLNILRYELEQLD